MQALEGNGRDGEQLLALPVVQLRTRWGNLCHVRLGTLLPLSAPKGVPWTNHRGRWRERGKAQRLLHHCNQEPQAE